MGKIFPKNKKNSISKRGRKDNLLLSKSSLNAFWSFILDTIMIKLCTVGKKISGNDMVPVLRLKFVSDCFMFCFSKRSNLLYHILRSS